MDAGTGNAVTRPSAGKISGRTVRTTAVRLPAQGRATGFPEPWKIPGFIGAEEIRNVYLPMGFSDFKIEGRGLGSALVLEFLLYYMTRPEYQIHVREEMYLDNMLDLF